MSKQLLGSSLRANAVAHTSGKGQGRAIPRREADPEPDIIVDRPLSKPSVILRWQFDAMKPTPLSTLSPGDRFTTRLAHRLGMVLAQGQGDVSGDPKLMVVPGEAAVRDRDHFTRRPPLTRAPSTLVRWYTEDGVPERRGPMHVNTVELGAGIVVNIGWWTTQEDQRAQ